MDVDDPRTTELRLEIIRNKRFLYRLYEEWYDLIRCRLPSVDGPVIELGSGAGFMKERIPGLITTDVIPVEWVDCILPADGHMPFGDISLRAIVMTDVLHHMKDARHFFREATRTVKPGGAVVMIEPWLTPWSRFVYRLLHSEPFLPDAKEWELPRSGPLSGANSALPWILFERDRLQFEREFPELLIADIKLFMPFAYLFSGGVSLRSFAPGWAYGPLRTIELALGHMGRWTAMFALIFLIRQPEQSIPTC